MLTNLALSLRRQRKTSLMLGAALLLGSCGGGGGGSSTSVSGPTPTPTPTPTATVAAGCTLRERQDWALAQLNEWYLFPTLMDTSVNPASYSDVQSYIDAILAPARAQNKDRYFTYLTSIAQENAYYSSGATAGFGFRLGYDTTGNRVFVIEGFEGGPALAAGLDRGTELVSINGQSVSSLMASGGPTAVINAMGPDTAGTSGTFVVRDINSGVQRTVTISKADFSLDPVSNRYGAKVLTNGVTKVGYINLRTFIDPADPDLRAAFADFKTQGVTQLIVDLRYNGGGLVSIAELFDDLMGLGHNGQVMSYTTFRDSKAANNQTTLFAEQPQSIAPMKVAFIGSRGTASASELTMNAMLPYLGSNVALVGTNTYGKPVGQIALDRSACDDRLRVIAFKTENANHQSDYFNGIASLMPNTCSATDDITHQLGDPNETMVKTALDYLTGRSCTAISAITTQAVSQQARLLAPEQTQSTVRREVPGAY